MASQVFTTTGSQTWNWPAGVTSVTAEALGGGGGSGTASGNPATGGGGKGGSYAKTVITKGAESLLTIVVGTGGALAGAGAASTVDQAGTIRVSAAGGAGGATQATSSANGAGGTTLNGANTGTTTFAGGNGGTGNFTSGTQGSGAGGGAAGPTSVGGAASVNVAGTVGTGAWLDGNTYQVAGRAGVGNSTPGIAGTTYGGAASGGKASTGADQLGAVGGQGIVVLTWTPPNQSVTGVTLATTAVLNVPTVAYAPQAVTGVTLASTAVVSSRQPSVAYAVTAPTIDATSAAPPETLLVQMLSDGQVSSGAGDVGRQQSQTISGHTGILTSVAFEASPGGTPTDGLYFEIREGTFNGTLLATSAVFPASKLLPDDPITGVPRRVWTKVPLLTYVTLSAGTTYWVESYLTRVSLDSANYWTLWGHYAGTYAGGEWKNEVGNQLSPGFDLGFRLYTTAGATIIGNTQPVIGATLATTAAVTAPTITPPIAAVVGATRASTAVLYGPTVGDIVAGTLVARRRVVPHFVRDVFRRTFTLRYRSVILTVTAGAAPPPTTQDIVGATIGGSVGDTLLEDGTGVLLEDGSGLLLEGYTGTAQTFAPTVDQTVLSQNVTTIQIASTVQTFAPTVLLTQAVTTTPIYSTAEIYYDQTALASQGGLGSSNAVLTLPGVGVCQTVSGHTGTVVLVELKLSSEGGPTDAMYLEIRSGTVNGPLLGTSWVVPATTFPVHPSNGWISFRFIGGVVFAAGTTYFIKLLLTRTASDSGRTVHYFYDSTNPYAGGSITDSAGVPVAGSDIAFWIYKGTSHTVTAGPVAVGGTTIAPTSIARAPTTVAPGPVTVVGATRLSTTQIFAPSVATGPVGITGATLASTSIINVPSVAVGPVAVTGATLASTSAVTAPSVALTLTGATIASTVGLFPPQMVTQTVTTLVRLTTALLFTATVGLPIALVTTSTVASASQITVPSVAVGPVTVSGDTRLSTAQTFAPTVVPGPRTITGATIFSNETEYSPSVVGGLLRIFLPPIGVSSYTLLYDDFNRPDEDPLAGNWGHARQPGAARPLKIVSNQIRSTSGGASYWQMAQPVDFNVAVDIPTTPTTGTTTTTFSVLNDPASTTPRNGFDLTVRSATAVIEWSLSRWLAGGQTTLIANASTGTVAPCSFGMRRIGTTIEVWARLSGGAWTLVGSVTDANLSIPLYGTLFIGNNWFLDNFGTVPVTQTLPTQVFPPLVAAAGVTAVDGTTLASTVVLNVPTVLPQSVAVSGATIAATSLVRVASITVGPVSVTCAFIPSTAQVFTATVTTGPVTVVGGTIASGVLLFAPTVAPGPVTVVGATRPTTIQTFAASVAPGPVTVIGGTVPATAVLFVPALTQVDAGAIGGQTIATGAIINAPSVVGGLAIIGVPFIAATSAVQAPSLTVGPVTVLAASRLSTAQIFVPSLAVGAVTVAGATLTASSQTFAPTLLIVITGATIGSGSSTFAPTLTTLVGIAIGTIPSTSQAFAPTLTPLWTILAPTRASASLTFAPAVTTLTAVTTTPLASTAALFSPTVLTIGSLGGPTTGPSSQLFGVTVTTGSVAVTGGTCTSTLQVFIPTIVAGGTPVTGGTIGTTALLFAPTTIGRLDGTFIASTASLFPPTVKITQFVTTVLVPTGDVRFAPSVLALWAVTGGTRLSTTQTFAPSITTGPIGVIGSTVPATVLLTAPAIGVGPVAVTVSHRASTLQVFAPTVSYVVNGAHRAIADALFPPALATGPVTVSTGAIVSTIQIFPPSLGAGITTAFFVNTTVPFAPTLAPHVTTPLWIVRTQLFPPSAIPLGEMILTFLPSGSVVFPPFMVGHAPPPEILDFTSNLVREVMGESSLDRVAEQDVVLTTAVTGDVILTRVHETTTRVLMDRVLAITVER